MDQYVIPECFIDTNIVETLVPPNRQYNHQKGCGTVAKVMKSRFADRFALGIIDKDKNQLDYLKEFTEICSNGNLILHKHTSKHHYIIQINPAIERFMVINAEAVGISLEDFGLPVDFELLKRTSKTINSKNDRRFKQLFTALNQRGAPDILRLSAWIFYLKDTNYNADPDTLREM